MKALNMMKIFALIREYRLTALIAIAAVGLAVLSSCTVQQGKSLLSAQTSSGDSVQKVVDSVPFAYDVAVDTISYNSCVGGDLNSSGKLHGIKLGANEGFVDTTGTGAVKGGLKLRSDFLLYLAKNVDPTFPNTSISPSQIQYILQNSPVNNYSQVSSVKCIEFAMVILRYLEKLDRRFLQDKAKNQTLT